MARHRLPPVDPLPGRSTGAAAVVFAAVIVLVQLVAPSNSDKFRVWAR